MSDSSKLFGVNAESGRWLFVILGLIINLCLGSVYSYSVFKNPVEFSFNKVTAQQSVPEIKDISDDALGKVFALKAEGADELKANFANLDSSLLIKLFKLDPAKDADKAAGYVTQLKVLTPEQLEALLSIEKVSSFQSNLPFMTFLAFFAVMVFLGGMILDKVGPRNLAVFGGIIVGAGWFFSSFATNINMLTLTYGVIAGSGVGFAYGCPIATAARWFPDKKGLAVGLALAGFGGSALLTAKIADVLITSAGLAATFKYFGIAFLFIIILLSLPLKFPATGWKPAGWSPAAGTATSADLTTGQMVKTGAFWGLFFCYIIGCLAGLMAIGISKPVGTEIINIDKAVATTLVSVFAIFNAVGRPIFGTLTDKITPRNAAILNLLIVLVVSVMMLIAKEGSVTLYTIAFMGFWLCLGGWLAIAPTATATFFGIRNYAKNYGLVYLAYGIGAILGGLISGKAKDLFGSFTVAFYPTAGLAILGIVIAWLLIKPPKAA
ncbi:MAG TPA: OFA family MFS transporter [Deltaproteobacteria bacterium]|nr:OFA family MFS transporter [Deltaproteobacteria bacterium]